jgi:hypothetical protein
MRLRTVHLVKAAVGHGPNWQADAGGIQLIILHLSGPLVSLTH